MLEMGYLTELSREKMVLIFYCGVQNFIKFYLFQLFDLFINKVKKLVKFQCRIQSWKMFMSPTLSFSCGSFPSLSRSRFISLPLSLLIPHLCGEMSPSLILIIIEL